MSNDTETPTIPASESNVLLSGRCRQCKGWGSQGMHYRKELTGEYRTCMIDLMGDFNRDIGPMFRLEITYGNGKGVVTTHGDFGCINFDSEFEDR